MELHRGFLHDHCIELLYLLPRELHRPALYLFGLQRVDAALSICCNPLIDASSIEAQGLDDIFRAFSRFHLQHRTYSDFFQDFMAQLATVSIFHKHHDIMLLY